MRLGWTTSNYTTTYRAIKTIRVNGKNQTKIIKTFGSEKYICETYGVTDAKAWAKEQVRLMNEAEKEDAATFTIELNSGTDLVMDEQRRFNGGYLFLQAIYYELGLHKICRASHTGDRQSRRLGRADDLSAAADPRIQPGHQPPVYDL